MPEHTNFQEGEALYQQKKFREAIMAFTMAIESSPKDAEIYYQRAMAFCHLNNLGEALEDLNQAVKHDPKNPFRYASRAYIKGRAGDTMGGIADYKKAIELDPEDAISENNLGLLEEKMGYEQQSKTRFARADELAERLSVEQFLKEDAAAFTYLEDLSTPPPTEVNVKKPGLLFLVGRVFQNKEARKEYLTFIRRGFKL